MFISIYFLYMKKKTSWILIKISWLLKCSNCYHKHWPWFRSVWIHAGLFFTVSGTFLGSSVCALSMLPNFRSSPWISIGKILSPHAKKPKVRNTGSITIHDFCIPILQFLTHWMQDQDIFILCKVARLTHCCFNPPGSLRLKPVSLLL